MTIFSGSKKHCERKVGKTSVSVFILFVSTIPQFHSGVLPSFSSYSFLYMKTKVMSLSGMHLALLSVKGGDVDAPKLMGLGQMLW